MSRPMIAGSLILTILIVAALLTGAAAARGAAPAAPCVDGKPCYWQKLDRDFHKSLRAAAHWHGVSYEWLHGCAHSEGGHGPAFIWGNDGAGSLGPFQFLRGTFEWMSNEAWKTARRKGLRIPIKYKRRDSMVGQTWTAAWAFSRGLSYHWYGRGC